MGRLHCPGKHMMQTMGSDVTPVQDGASVQLYQQALNHTKFYITSKLFKNKYNTYIV